MFRKKEKKLNKNNFYKQFQKVVEKYKKIIILGHKDPDGDCIGAQIALYYSLKQKHPKKEVVFPFAQKEYSDFLLPNNYKEKTIDKKIENALIILVDFNSKQRSPIQISKKNFIIIIDHHQKENNDFGDLVWIDSKSPACCEMVYVLLNNLNWNIDKNIASALLLGIISDTGSFKYPNVTKFSFEVASHLLNCGANLQEIHQNLKIKKLIDLKIESYCLNNLNYKNKFIYFIFKPKDKIKILGIEKIKEPFGEKIKMLSGIKNINVWAFFTQIKTKELIKVSLRSVNEINVAKIAKKYGGGGHKNAAGIKVKNWKTANKIIQDIEKII